MDCSGQSLHLGICFKLPLCCTRCPHVCEVEEHRGCGQRRAPWQVPGGRKRLQGGSWEQAQGGRGLGPAHPDLLAAYGPALGSGDLLGGKKNGESVFHTRLQGLGFILQARGGNDKIRFKRKERPCLGGEIASAGELGAVGTPQSLAPGGVPTRRGTHAIQGSAAPPAHPGTPAVLGALCSAMTDRPLSSPGHCSPHAPSCRQPPVSVSDCFCPSSPVPPHAHSPGADPWSPFVPPGSPAPTHTRDALLPCSGL